MSNNLGNLSELGNSDDESDWVPIGLKGLTTAEENGEVSQELPSIIDPKIIYSEFNFQLETGLGRDDLIDYISKYVDSLDEFDAIETFDLKIYMLDALDSHYGKGEGQLQGDEVNDILNCYIEADGEPYFLQDYDVGGLDHTV